MTPEKVVKVFEEYDLRRKKIFLFTGEDGRKFRRILLETENLSDESVIYLRNLIDTLYKNGFETPAKFLEKWLNTKLATDMRPIER